MTCAVAETVSLEDVVKARAYGLGFDLVGITSLGPMETAEAFDAWIEKGYAGDMDSIMGDGSRVVPLPVTRVATTTMR